MAPTGTAVRWPGWRFARRHGSERSARRAPTPSSRGAGRWPWPTPRRRPSPRLGRLPARRAVWGAKSASSNRTIPASSFVLDRLSAHVGRRHEGFVLQRNDGPVNHNDFAYYWRKAATGAGVAGLRFHELRHAYASALISAGCSVRAVQHALGARQAVHDHAPLLAPVAGRRGPAPPGGRCGVRGCWSGGLAED